MKEEVFRENGGRRVTPVLWMRDILAGAEAFTALTSPFLTSCILLRGGTDFFFCFSFVDGLSLARLQLGINSIPAAYRGDSCP